MLVQIYWSNSTVTGGMLFEAVEGMVESRFLSKQDALELARTADYELHVKEAPRSTDLLYELLDLSREILIAEGVGFTTDTQVMVYPSIGGNTLVSLADNSRGGGFRKVRFALAVLNAIGASDEQIFLFK